VTAYRVGSAAYPLFDGTGAAANSDARWNGRGRYIIYASEHYATALLEKAAQLTSVRLPRTLAYIRIDMPPDVSIEELQASALPDWDANDKIASRLFGNRWYDEQRSLILLVPSLVAPGLERNVLINQRHVDFARLTSSRPEPVRGHPRLFV
jgi:RES domain-containing protein